MSFATPDKLVMVSLLITREAVALQLFGPRGIWMSQRCPRHHHHLVNAPSPLLGRSARLASPVLGVRVSTARLGKGREGKGGSCSRGRSPQSGARPRLLTSPSNQSASLSIQVHDFHSHAVPPTSLVAVSP